MSIKGLAGASLERVGARADAVRRRACERGGHRALKPSLGSSSLLKRAIGSSLVFPWASTHTRSNHDLARRRRGKGGAGRGL
jgi:hypothetical protein